MKRRMITSNVAKLYWQNILVKLVMIFWEKIKITFSSKRKNSKPSINFKKMWEKMSTIQSWISWCNEDNILKKFLRKLLKIHLNNTIKYANLIFKSWFCRWYPSYWWSRSQRWYQSNFIWWLLFYWTMVYFLYTWQHSIKRKSIIIFKFIR